MTKPTDKLEPGLLERSLLDLMETKYTSTETLQALLQCRPPASLRTYLFALEKMVSSAGFKVESHSVLCECAYWEEARSLLNKITTKILGDRLPAKNLILKSLISDEEIRCLPPEEGMGESISISQTIDSELVYRKEPREETI